MRRYTRCDGLLLLLGYAVLKTYEKKLDTGSGYTLGWSFGIEAWRHGVLAGLQEGRETAPEVS